MRNVRAHYMEKRLGYLTGCEQERWGGSGAYPLKEKRNIE